MKLGEMPLVRFVPVLLAVVLCSVAFTSRAQPSADRPLLHALFQDHAVLQHDQPIRVWGHARPHEEVRVTFAGKKVGTRADARGDWEVQLAPLKAGGPHTLVATAGEVTQTVSDVLVGDVWLCSGQSNMELQVWRALDARAEIASANNDRIRLFTVPQTSAVVTQENFNQPVRWQPVNSESVREFSAACYYFARELQKTIDVPMGLINASWGGSRIQAWISGDALRTLGNDDAELDVLARYAHDPVGAVGEWGTLWQRWWKGRTGAATDGQHATDQPSTDQPWAEGAALGEWRDAPVQLGAWERWGVPALADFNGMVWYRTTVELDATQAAQEAVLVLGPADEIDMTWVNGRGVGSTYGAGDARQYTLPAGVLHAGINTLVVNVLDTYHEGGLSGPASAHALHLAGGGVVPLDRGWKYQVVPVEVGNSPRAPWQSASGLSTLYNGMIAPLGRFGLRGVLWYQGESNTFEHERYADLLRTLRSDWRTQFDADVPMLFVQLPNYGKPATKPGASDWASMREAQRQVAGEDPQSGLVVSIDLGDRYDIHPGNKQELGRRLARSALAVVYAKDLSAAGPVPISASHTGSDAITLTFSDVTDGLVAYGADGPIGFELCGVEQGACQYATAEIHDHQVTLRAPNATLQAARVRYCWADSPVCTLFDGSGLPAGPFEMFISSRPHHGHER